MDRLEQLEDQALATSLLKEFNDKSADVGRLLMNLDPQLDHHDWKEQCDRAQKELELLISRILSL